MNKLVDQYSNRYRYFTSKKAINTDYSISTKNIDSNPKAPKFKVNDRVRITTYIDAFSKGYTENWSREIFIIDFVLKTNVKIKDLTGEKVIRNFYEKELM